MEIQELEEVDESLQYPIFTIAVAVNGSKNSKYAVRWALEKFVPEGRVLFKILHVRPKITMVPTPMGYLPISEVRDEVASAFHKEMTWKTNAMLLPYKEMCAKRHVEAEAVIIEADDVAYALSEEITKFAIRKLVIGASGRHLFSWKSKQNQMSSRIAENTPSFCTVYVVAKGKLLSVRSSTSATDENTILETNSGVASYSLSSSSSSIQSEWTDTDATTNFSAGHASLSVQREQALAATNHNFGDISLIPGGVHHSGATSLSTDDEFQGSRSITSESQYVNGTISNSRNIEVENSSQNLDQASTSVKVTDSSFSRDEVDLSFELEKVRIELKHLHEMCQNAQDEADEVSRQISETAARQVEETIKLKEIKLREEQTTDLARQEREGRKAAEKEAGLLRVCTEKEIMQRQRAEYNASCEVNEKLRLEKALSHSDEPYKKYTWEEIEIATSSFSEALRIGVGANGTVYKGSFHHTVAAVKVLHSNDGHTTKQFRQELEILGRIHHPHLLMLLGACPERGCLVYEFMENGSLDDRLLRRDNTPPLPWYYRYRIAWEVASALAFLHNSKPEPIIHRDLKPANILLDENFLSKIGDVGISTLIPPVNFSMSTVYKDTAPVGTICYIDPEYQRSGLVSLKSDVYALGMVILQLLTAKSPMGLTYIVETALEDGTFTNILDSGAGKWPMEETQELALLGLNCAELRRKDRPDLKDRVLPMLERLKGFADKAHDIAQRVPSTPPNHFICPILKEVMDDPCVASDGYTYDRRAIETWFSMNEKSPMTNLQVPNKILIPNFSLLSAIKEWKSRAQ